MAVIEFSVIYFNDEAHRVLGALIASAHVECDACDGRRRTMDFQFETLSPLFREAITARVPDAATLEWSTWGPRGVRLRRGGELSYSLFAYLHRDESGDDHVHVSDNAHERQALAGCDGE